MKHGEHLMRIELLWRGGHHQRLFSPRSGAPEEDYIFFVAAVGFLEEDTFFVLVLAGFAAAGTQLFSTGAVAAVAAVV